MFSFTNYRKKLLEKALEPSITCKYCCKYDNSKLIQPHNAGKTCSAISETALQINYYVKTVSTAQETARTQRDYDKEENFRYVSCDDDNLKTPDSFTTSKQDINDNIIDNDENMSDVSVTDIVI